MRACKQLNPFSRRVIEKASIIFHWSTSPPTTRSPPLLHTHLPVEEFQNKEFLIPLITLPGIQIWMGSIALAPPGSHQRPCSSQIAGFWLRFWCPTLRNYITPSLIIMVALCVNRLIPRKVRKQDRKTPEFQKTGMGHRSGKEDAKRRSQSAPSPTSQFH